MNNINMRYIIKILHSFLLIFTGVLIITALVNITIFSKPNLMDVIEYAMNVSDIDIGPIDSLFIARVIRQQLWEIHFYIGSVVSILTFAIMILLLSRQALNHKSIIYNAISVSFLFFTGIVMHYRDKLSISTDSFEVLKTMHWVSISIFAIAIVFHLYEIIKSYR